jgi:hypothetical protein
VKILDRLDELDYRLHLRRRPDDQRPELTERKVWFLRALWCLLILYASAAIAVAVAGGTWLTFIPALAVATVSWASYDRETRQRIVPWLPIRRRRS